MNWEALEAEHDERARLAWRTLNELRVQRGEEPYGRPSWDAPWYREEE